MSHTAVNEAPAGAEPKRRGGINGRVVLHAVRRHPLALLGVLTLAGSVAAGVWFFLPLTKVTAAVVFHIASQPNAVLRPTAVDQVGFDSYKQAQAALVKRRLTLTKALGR